MKLTLLTIGIVSSGLALGFCLVEQSLWGFAVLPIAVVIGYFWGAAQDLGCDD